MSVTVQEKDVSANGIRVHYREAGQGEPLVMLHGTGPGADAWSNFRQNVDVLGEHHRLLLIDFPRFGGSEMAVIPGPRLDVLSGVLRDVLDALGIERTDIAGNSMGGQVALKLAIDSPERVGRLVLVAPAPFPRSVFSPMPTELVRQIAGFYKGDGPTRDKMRRLMETLVFDPALVTDEAVEERYAAASRPEVVEANRGPHWEHQSLEHELHLVQAPTLLVWGQEDRASPIDQAFTMLRLMQHAELHVLPRSGHSVQIENARRFEQLALEFLSR
jgi:4,5:9,10-diseco-3-hydroxy-5,9,17-trioxoandrosta-1(10),2-diene-4-oate hydrolase